MGNKRNQVKKGGQKIGRPKKKIHHLSTANAIERRKERCKLARPKRAVETTQESLPRARHKEPSFLKTVTPEEKKRTAPGRAVLRNKRIMKAILNDRRLRQLKVGRERKTLVATTPAESETPVVDKKVSTPRRLCQPRSASISAVAKRRQRALKEIHPELLNRIQVQPISTQRLTPLETLKLALDLNLKSRGLRLAAKRLNVILAPISECEIFRAQCFKNSMFEIIPPQKGYRRSLMKTLEELVACVELSTYSVPLKIYIAIDGGGDGTLKSTKIVTFLADSDKPCSPHQASIYAIVFGKESDNELREILEVMDSEIERIHNDGITKNDVIIPVEMFLVGDLKMLCLCLGLQGCSAINCCPFCYIKKNKLDKYDRQNKPDLRTIENLSENFENFSKECETTNKKEIVHLRQKYGSVYGSVIVKNIPLTRVVPPVLHLIMGVVNETLKCYQKTDPIRAAQLLCEAKIIVQKGRKNDLTGSEGQKLVNFVSSLNADDHSDIFTATFASIQSLFNIAKTNADLSNADDVIARVLSNFRQIRTLTPKLHVLEAHVNEFIEVHNMWGNFSEQGIESMHHEFNKRAKDLPGKSQLSKAKCFLTDFAIRHSKE